MKFDNFLYIDMLKCIAVEIYLKNISLFYYLIWIFFSHFYFMDWLTQL